MASKAKANFDHCSERMCSYCESRKKCLSIHFLGCCADCYPYALEIFRAEKQDVHRHDGPLVYRQGEIERGSCPPFRPKTMR